jgi:hypothetical protein
MNKNNIITFVAIAIAAFSILIATTAYAQVQLPPQAQKQHTQLTPQEQQLSRCPASEVNSLPPLVPGAFPVCQGSPLLAGVIPHGPSAEQMQRDVAASEQQSMAIQAQINARLAKSPAGTTLDQILQQMTDQGLMNCPIIKNPAHACQVSPPIKAGISPPIAP